MNTIKLCYNEYFNINDVYNHYLHKRYFPLQQRSGWQSNYTDFLFACFQMNLYTLYHELDNAPSKKMEWKKFTTLLYEELMGLVTIVENRRWDKQRVNKNDA